MPHTCPQFVRSAFHSACLTIGIAGWLPADEPPQIVVRMTFVEVPADQRADRVKPVRTVVGEAASIRRVLELIADRDDAKTLSQPTVVTQVGREATIQIGGEFLVPVLQRDGKWTTEPRMFGTKVDLVPKIVEDKLDLAIAAEFSERDFENAVTINGREIPGLTTRRFHLDGSFEPGQAMLLIAEHDETTRIVFVHPESAGGLPK